MSTFFKQHRRLLTVLLLNLVTLGLLGSLLWLRSDLGLKIQNLVTEQTTLKERAAQLEQLRASVLETAADRQELERHFITPDSLPTFIEQIEDLGIKNGVESSLTSVEAVEQPTIKLRFSLRLIGSRANILRFVNDLEQLPYRLRLATGNLQSGERDVVWSGNFNLELLSYQAEANTPINN